MDGRLESLSRFFAIPTDAERSACFAEFVGQVIEDVQAAIQCHKEWWLIDGERLPPDIKEVVLLNCVEHFPKVRELERQIREDTRKLGVTEATWPPFVAANVQPVVQQVCRTHPTLTDSAALIADSSNDLNDVVTECLEQLSQAFHDPLASSVPPVAASSDSPSDQSVEPCPGTPLPSGAEILELFEILVGRLKGFRLPPEAAQDRVADRICMAIAESADADGQPIKNFAAYVAKGVMAFDRFNHGRELQRVRNGLLQLQMLFTENTTAAPEDEVIYRELRSLILNYTVQLPEQEREIFVAWACDQFRPQQICEKLFHRLGTLETSRDVSKWKNERKAHFTAMLTKHGYDVPPESRDGSSDSN